MAAGQAVMCNLCTSSARVAPQAAAARPLAVAVRPQQRGAAALQQRAASRVAARHGSAVVVRAVLDVTSETWEAEVLQAKGAPVLVDFWAQWCGPCRLMHPMMAWAEKEYGAALKVVKVDCTDTNKDVMEKYKVYGLPCFILFKDGAEVADSHSEGAMTKKALQEYLAKHVGVQAAVAQ